MPVRHGRAFSDLLRLKGPEYEVLLLQERFRKGADDASLAAWVAQHDPPALMISGDTGAQTKSAQLRLPGELLRRGVSAVYLSRKLCQRNGFEKIRMLMVCFPRLEAIYHSRPGTRHKILAHGESYRLEEWALT